MQKLETQNTCGLSWLHSKQTTQSLEKLKLFEEHYKSMDKFLKTRIVKHVKNNRTHIGRLLYSTKDCYIDNMNFDEFVCSVIECAGEEKLREAILKAIDIILKKDKVLKDKFNKKDIEKAIKIYMYYQPYIGYAFEQRIRDLAKNNGYEVYTSEELDKKYAIDMQIHSPNHNKVIGLQLKTWSFWCISKNDKDKYRQKNKLGILNNYCEDVFYVFHDLECNIVSNDFESVIQYEKVCSTNERYFLVEDEEDLLRGIEQAFSNIGVVENGSNLR